MLMLVAGSPSWKRTAPEGSRRCLPLLASHSYSSSVRPLSCATFLSAQTTSEMGASVVTGSWSVRTVFIKTSVYQCYPNGTLPGVKKLRTATQGFRPSAVTGQQKWGFVHRQVIVPHSSIDTAIRGVGARSPRDGGDFRGRLL